MVLLFLIVDNRQLVSSAGNASIEPARRLLTKTCSLIDQQHTIPFTALALMHCETVAKLEMLQLAGALKLWISKALQRDANGSGAVIGTGQLQFQDRLIIDFLERADLVNGAIEHRSMTV
jgi:hypothetical protein